MECEHGSGAAKPRIACANRPMRTQFAAKQYSRPSPPVLLRSACEQPPSGPRERCELFQDFDGVIVAQSDAVGMADHRRALRAARPVLAGAVLARRESRAVRLRSRQHVVAVRRIAAAVDDFALLGQRGLFGQIVGAVQLGDVPGDHHALRVLPRSLADAVARVHRRLAVGGLRSRDRRARSWRRQRRRPAPASGSSCRRRRDRRGCRHCRCRPRSRRRWCRPIAPARAPPQQPRTPRRPRSGSLAR